MSGIWRTLVTSSKHVRIYAKSQHVEAFARNAVATKTIDDLPGPRGWPLVGNFPAYVRRENFGYLHILMDRYYKKYGPIFRDKLGSVEQVHVCDPDLIGRVYRAQGFYPDRPPIQAWREWRHHNKKKLGILTAEGEEWMKPRKVLSKRMLKPEVAMTFADDLNLVLDDAMVMLKKVRDEKGDLELANRLPNELYKWAFESIGTILFETRLGCLEDEMPPMTQDFINSIAKMLSTSLQVIIGEKFHRCLNTPFWQNHAEAWNTMFSTTKHLVDQRLAKILPYIDGEEISKEYSGAFLTYLLSSKQLTMEDIYSNLLEVLLGAVDTTSNTLCFILHLLATHPEIQTRLHEEVTMVTGGATPSGEDVKNMPYLKCVIKETLRIYPVITMNVRVLNDDILLNGYLIPKKTMFVMHTYSCCYDEKVFERPLEFIPERWSRDGSSTPHPFAVMSWGFGTRSCLGRRVAELELYLALARISQYFDILPLEGVEFKPKLRTLLTPGDSVPVKLRNK